MFVVMIGIVMMVFVVVMGMFILSILLGGMMVLLRNTVSVGFLLF